MRLRYDRKEFLFSFLRCTAFRSVIRREMSFFYIPIPPVIDVCFLQIVFPENILAFQTGHRGVRRKEMLPRGSNFQWCWSKHIDHKSYANTAKGGGVKNWRCPWWECGYFLETYSLPNILDPVWLLGMQSTPSFLKKSLSEVRSWKMIQSLNQ